MATADLATCKTRVHAPLVSSLFNMFNNLVNVSIKLDSVAHFLVYQILNYVRFSAPQM